MQAETIAFYVLAGIGLSIIVLLLVVTINLRKFLMNINDLKSEELSDDQLKKIENVLPNVRKSIDQSIALGRALAKQATKIGIDRENLDTYNNHIDPADDKDEESKSKQSDNVEKQE